MKNHIYIGYFNIFLAIAHLIGFAFYPKGLPIGIVLHIFGAVGLLSRKPWGLDFNFGMFGLTTLVLSSLFFLILASSILSYFVGIQSDSIDADYFLLLGVLVALAVIYYLPLKLLKNEATYKLFNKKFPSQKTV